MYLWLWSHCIPISFIPVEWPLALAPVSAPMSMIQKWWKPSLRPRGLGIRRTMGLGNCWGLAWCGTTVPSQMSQVSGCCCEAQLEPPLPCIPISFIPVEWPLALAPVSAPMSAPALAPLSPLACFCNSPPTLWHHWCQWPYVNPILAITHTCLPLTFSYV